MELLRHPISAYDRILDRSYVISVEFLLLSRRRSSSRNVPSGEERGETLVFAGYAIICLLLALLTISTYPPFEYCLSTS